MPSELEARPRGSSTLAARTTHIEMPTATDVNSSPLSVE
jgi:hypothetical protein